MLYVRFVTSVLLIHWHGGIKAPSWDDISLECLRKRTHSTNDPQFGMECVWRKTDTKKRWKISIEYYHWLDFQICLVGKSQFTKYDCHHGILWNFELFYLNLLQSENRVC